MNNPNLFPNLFAAITAENSTRLNDFTTQVNAETDIKAMLAKWQYSDLLTKVRQVQKWEIEALKLHLITCKTKRVNKEIAKQLLHLQTVSNATELKSIVVSVEWKKSKMWGSNPSAEAKVESEYFDYYNSGSIGGCGYDKNSTAIANAVNQSNEFLKLLYTLKDQNLNIPNRDLFGYGSGYGILPRLEGGVGASCYPTIFEKIGFTFNNTASGKTFDVYTIIKK